ncbi:uncharacterized protein LOC130713055 [Lotus japonicus]|uniref:uncharacterized protein LOC130713055 n=1 Tax=Lotus japonicus TaxID=34305 RepID=UPI0025826FC8|nr:uncharacterized protein LOC130713055 [Lotus japonicus]
MESELAAIRTALAAVTTAMKDLPTTLGTMVEKAVGKSVGIDVDSGDARPEREPREKTPESVGLRESGSDQPVLQGEALNEFRQSVKKVELPMFDGKDLAGWISRAEIYFKVQETSPEVKVSLAQLSMEGGTIHFYNSLLATEEELTWERFRDALLERYGGNGDGDVYEQLSELRQQGTVEEYITDFEYLTAQIPKLPEKQYQGYFLHGLKEEIRGKVRSLVAMGGVNRARLLVVTRAVEKEVKGDGVAGQARANRFGGNGSRSGFSGATKGNGTEWIWVKGNKETGQTVNRPNSNPRGDQTKNTGDIRRAGPRDRGFNHLSYPQLMERRQKGLCFKCGGPYHRNHVCPDKHLRLLILEEDGEELDESKMLAMEVNEDEEETQGELSLMSLCELGMKTGGIPRTMKLRGTINGVPVVVLEDSGATHNFVDCFLVRRLGWEVVDTPRMTVKLGDGYKSQAQGRCAGLKIEMGEYHLRCSPQLFDLGGPDIVLGIEWLKTLGDTIVNWDTQLMSFWSDKKWITLQGMDTRGEHMEALQSITATGERKPGLLGTRNEEKAGKQLPGEINSSQLEELDKLLYRFDVVFQEKQGLPPGRGREHCITIQEGKGPVNVRPYRYPHHHKNEIEKQVREMLSAGIIRQSTSAYSSPVILVKKKDQTW